MSLRIRKDGTVICAAESKPEPGDCYLDDWIHQRLDEMGVLHPSDDPESNQWYFSRQEEESEKKIPNFKHLPLEFTSDEIQVMQKAIELFHRKINMPKKR